MSKTYLPYDPDQQLLLPAALQEWLPEDHLVYFISDVVDQLDLSEITARYEGERRGGPPYNPRMMVKVLLYAYCVGVPSSRRIATRLHEDIAFRVLAANNTPDFRTISDFRKDHPAALPGLFLQVLVFCQREGLVKLVHVALDGTKVRANAPKHKAMSYKRMKVKEAQLQGEVDELLRRAQEVDEEEDRRYGKDKRGDELPAELSFREGRLERIREAMAALAAEAQAAAEQAEGKDHPGVPDDQAQRNFTDAESRIMPAPGARDFLSASGGSGGGGQPTSGGSGGAGHQPGFGQAAGGGDDRGSHRQCGRSTQGGIRRRRLLFGPGRCRFAGPGHRPLHRAGKDPPRAQTTASAQRTHPQRSPSQGPDAPQVADQAGPPALRLRRCVTNRVR